MRKLIMVLAFLVSVLSVSAAAQTAQFSGAQPGTFGEVNVGSTSLTPISMIFTFDTAGTLGSTAVVTQGATDLDFADAGTGTCTAGTAYNIGDTCTVDVSFSPKFPGMRYGAAELLVSSGSVLATGYVQGTGVGPQVNFFPGTQSVVADMAHNGLGAAYGVAVDSSGNVYIADHDHSKVYKLTLSASGYTWSIIAPTRKGGYTPSSPGVGYPHGVAVDGSGNVYICDLGNYRVLKETLSAGSYTWSTVANFRYPTLLYAGEPNSVAVDNSGNVYVSGVTDLTKAGSENYLVVKETPTAAGGYIQSVVASTVANGLGWAVGIAVDSSGNVYLGDNENGRVLKETLSAGTYTQSVLADSATNGLMVPYGVAVDGNGNVYISDLGNSKTTGRVLKETLSAGSYTQSVIADGATNGLWGAFGVAVDPSGNVYIADSDNFRILKEDFADPPSLTFAKTAVGSTSTDSPQTVTVENVGNSPLSFAIPATGNNPSIAENFTLNSSGASACQVEDSSTETAETVAPNASCDLVVSFEPVLGGAPTGSLVLTDDNLNASEPLYASQSIPLSGTILQVTPTITWAAPTAITYGTPLSVSQLDATSSVDGTFTYSPAAGAVLTVGLQTLTVKFTPTNTVDFNTATATVKLKVKPATPTITWATPAPVPYGTVLGAAQLDATASTAGTFTYSPVAGTVLGLGSHIITATFTPADSTDYTGASKSITLVVNQATPAITWPTPASITYGTALGAAQLDASSPVAGSFSYFPAAGTVLSAGSHTITATFTPTDSTDYTGASGSVTLVVNRATPTITWPTPTPITYGAALSATQLDATASVPGAFSYSSPAGTILTVGSHGITATFTPTNSADYATATASVTLTVNLATPAITWPTPAAITYGAGLGSAQLDATSPVAGTFAYSPSSGTVLGAGPQMLKTKFTPTDITDYATATTTVTLVVNQATPTIAWGAPAAIFSGTALSASQLDATASVPGTFTYNPALGAILPVGNDILSVTFTPTDNVDYAAATATTTLTVNPQPNPVPFLGNITPAIADAGGAAFTITINGSGFLPASTVYWSTTALTTQFVSSSQLTATVTAADIATPGATAITVQTPAPGGGTSDVLQFEVDSSSGTATAPSVPSAVVTVTAGSTATYSISFPAAVTNATATCLNLPAGAICSYSFATGTLTVSTSSTTPSGTYQVTVVFDESVASTSSAFIVLPILLLPLFFLRRKLAAHGMWSAVSLCLIVLAATAFSAGCGGSSSPTKTTIITQSVRSSGVVGMKVQ